MPYVQTSQRKLSVRKDMCSEDYIFKNTQKKKIFNALSTILSNYFAFRKNSEY